MATITVHHPTLVDVTREVDKADADQWTDAGWRKSEPKAVKEAREAAEASS